ncbi:MAG: Gfo/Idh/MocA family oxidoreductase [Chloroflexota bacterium]|nr:MAG: Gfo/Idh/MocA family oxidoreductase [Chloroflexota bacterium]
MPIVKADRRLRVGIVGLGQIARAAHLDACAKARNVELAAVCDVAADLVDAAHRAWNPKAAYHGYDAMLADPLVEAVIVATADQFHVPLTLRALVAGKHVLLEKPMGVTVEECESLRAAVEASDSVVQIGHMKRFDPGIAYAREFARAEIGDILAVRAWYCDSVYRYTMTDNLQPIPIGSAASARPDADPRSDRQRYLLMTHGCHLIDTARYLGGEIVAVRGRHQHRADAHCWFIETELANGALGHLELTVPVRGDFEEGFRVYGSEGSIVGRVYLPWFHKSSEVECFSTRDRVYRRPLGEDAHTYKLQLEGFADTILDGGPQVGANVEDGIANTRALVAIARSCAGGEWVRLDAVTGGV